MGGRSLDFFVCLLVAVALLETPATAAEFELQWKVPPSTDFYVNWVRNKTFSIGDSITFNWTGLHTVADVSKPEYDRCSNTSSVLGSSPARVNLSSGGNRYFICTIDSHCALGQKLSISVISRATQTLSAVGPVSAAASAVILYILSFHV